MSNTTRKNVSEEGHHILRCVPYLLCNKNLWSSVQDQRFPWQSGSCNSQVALHWLTSKLVKVRSVWFNNSASATAKRIKNGTRYRERITVISATHVTLNELDASESITWPCFKSLNAHFSRPTAVSGKWVALNYLNTSFVCITGLVSALGQCSNGPKWIMHSPSACALSRPWLLLHRPRALIKPCNAHTTAQAS